MECAKSGLSLRSPAQRQHPGWVSLVITIGVNQGGKVREAVSEGSHGLCIQAAILTKADDVHEVW